MSAFLQIEYDELYCALHWHEYFSEHWCADCNAPGPPDCPYYISNTTERRIDDTCTHVACVHKYKGMTVKKYEIGNDEEFPGLFMWVTVGGKEYRCDKVILDGVKIFPKQEEEK